MVIAKEIDNSRDFLSFLKSQTFSISSHYFLWGGNDELFGFLKDKAKSITFLKHPFYYSSALYSTITVVEANRMHIARIKPRLNRTLVDYTLDFLSTILVYTFYKRGSIFIGIDPVNAMAGLFLKRLKLTQIVIFYASDYTPRRFDNRFLNKMYHLAEAFCAMKCDYTWNVTRRIIEARERKLKRLGWTTPPHTQLVVRIPIGYSRARPVDEVKRHSLIYSGTLGEWLGIDIVLNVLNKVRERIPDIELLISGRGPLRDELHARVHQLSLDQCVKLIDYIPSREDFIDLLSKYAIGLAVYKPSDQTLVNYADVGKLKVYAACGLPVILTGQSFNAEEVESLKTGIVVNYDENDIYDAICELMLNDERYLVYRENALRWVTNFASDKIFSEALNPIFSNSLNKSS